MFSKENQVEQKLHIILKTKNSSGIQNIFINGMLSKKGFKRGFRWSFEICSANISFLRYPLHFSARLPIIYILLNVKIMQLTSRIYWHQNCATYRLTK